MKKTACMVCFLLMVFGVIALAQADVKIDVAHFPDDNFRRYILDAGFDTDGDGVLSDAELRKTWQIDCTGCSIADLKGIEYFPAIGRLYCGKNQLTSLDVSKCPELVDLICNENQLTSLDVSKCPELVSLQCNNNNLMSLDVSHCKSLKSLICYENQLTSLK